MSIQLSDAVEAYEHLLHVLRLHGRTSAILLPFFALGLLLAGCSVMSMILEAIRPRRVTADRCGQRRPKVLAMQSDVVTVGEMIELDLSAQQTGEPRSQIR